MSSYSKINKVIQNKLNSKRKILSRQGSSDIFSPSDKDSRRQYQENVIKTPYILMVSTDAVTTCIDFDDESLLSQWRNAIFPARASKSSRSLPISTQP